MTVPLVFQLGLLGWLATLQREAELQGEKALHAQRVSEAINFLSKDIYTVITSFADFKSIDPDDDTGAKFLAMADKVRADYKVVAELTRDNPQQAAVVDRARAAGETAMTQVLNAQNFIRNGGELVRDERKKFWHKMREYIRVIMSNELLAIGRSEAEIVNHNPELQANYRKQTQQALLIGGGVNVLLALCLALYLTKSITGRLKLLSENAYLMAIGRPLNPALSGSDEIASVDQAFHKMAAELREASRKQGAIIDNARDMICSLDQSGTFLEVNPASKAIIGYDAEELVGRHFIDLVPQTERKKALEFSENLRSGTNLRPLEIVLTRSDGQPIDALWSAHWSEEEETFFCVLHDITDRRQAERMKQEVVAMVTHDLRTPLATIQNFLEFLSDGFYGSVNEKGAKYLVLAQRNGDRMISLINDLLDIEKIKSGMMELERGDLDLNKSFTLCQELQTSFADQMGVALDFRPTALFVNADEDRLARVLSNLVSNAIKFSPRGSKVTVWAEQDENMIAITVQDQGPGVPAHMLESVFDRFQQVRGQGPQKGGSGLGLAICKAIVELHGGRIWLRSEEGKGSAFTFTLQPALSVKPAAR
ncbi:MAG: PAS domain S-box protein [Cyanobacteria bacterium SZAS TMP-1]|nr:PAS domain S-box protein [Cyanobacteria bacterium SZAS TMP-1]